MGDHCGPCEPAGQPAGGAPTSERLFGRQRELHALRTALHDGHRLITLTGPGGVGKTHLVATLLSTLEGSRALVLLSAATSMLEVTEAVVRELGWTVAGEAAERVLHARLPTYRGVLVLDNVEQIPDIAEGVSHLLDIAPELRVVVTSRHPLHLSAEYSLRLRPLDLPDPDAASEAQLRGAPAAELFLERARVANPMLVVDADTATDVARLCHLLDGLPLALKLVAARMDLFTPAAVVRWMEEQRLLPSTLGPRDTPRHRTLQATVDWSYRLLDDEHRSLFVRLSVFSGDFGVQQAAAVGGRPDGWSREALERLVAVGLLDRPGHADQPARYSMLRTVRLVARHMLDQLGELQRTRATHARAYRDLAVNLHARLDGPSPGPAHARFELEMNEFRSALEYCSSQDTPQSGLVALELVNSLALPLRLQGRAAEARRWLTVALERGRAHVSQYALGIANLAVLLTETRESPTAITLARLAAHHSETAGDPQLITLVQQRLALTLTANGRWAEAREQYQQAGRRCPPDQPGLRLALQLGRARSLLYLGDCAAALDELQDIQNAARAHGLRHRLNYTVFALGEAYTWSGMYDEAREQYRAYLDDDGSALGQIAGLTALALLETQSGHPQDALGHARHALHLARSNLGPLETVRTAAIEHVLAIAHHELHQPEQAEVHAERALLTYETLAEHFCGPPRALLTVLRAERASPETATTALRLLDDPQTRPWDRRFALLALAHATLPAGETAITGRLLQIVREQQESSGDHPGAPERRLYAQLRAVAGPPGRHAHDDLEHILLHARQVLRCRT